MNEQSNKRYQAVSLYEAGHTVPEIAKQLQQCESWVRKWLRRYKDLGFRGLEEQSRRPKKLAKNYRPEVRSQVIEARLALENKAKTGQGLKYIGGQAIRTLLKEQGVSPLPSVPTIERYLRQAGLTKKPSANEPEEKVNYPHLQPTKPHELVQVDIVPHYLQGGSKIACFNGLDVVSKYPAGKAFSKRTASNAVEALCHMWRQIGVPKYTQVDNESCFSGGATHPYVLGRVVRLALAVGTQLLFSPTYHPESNGHVERFHQDYDKHVWDDTYLAHLDGVNQQGDTFYQQYRQSGHLKQFKGETPEQRHYQHEEPQPLTLPADFSSSSLPLYAGQIHFLRQVVSGQTVRVLNVDWAVPCPLGTGVWVTLTFASTGATLSVWDLAPDQAGRKKIISHPFPLKEAVITLDDISSEVTNLPKQDNLSVVHSIAGTFVQLGANVIVVASAWSLERTAALLGMDTMS